MRLVLCWPGRVFPECISDRGLVEKTIDCSKLHRDRMLRYYCTLYYSAHTSNEGEFSRNDD